MTARCLRRVSIPLLATVLIGVGHAPPTSAQESDALITRNRARLNLAGAERILVAARSKAAEMKLKVNIAVVDDGGHLLAFARMDGARPASGYTAITKATTAATFRQSTGPVPPGVDKPDPLLNLSLQNAAAASGGKITTLYGGVPVVLNDQVIGAVGVGGARGEQDAEIAKAGIAALLEAIE
jgi:glc operon protein GlcG